MVDKINNMVVSLFLSIMCGDLLYLYFIGSWYDPIKAIEYSEIALLLFFGVFGVYRFIVLAKRI